MHVRARLGGDALALPQLLVDVEGCTGEVRHGARLSNLSTPARRKE
jgi:hypothetical protein